MRVAIGVDRLIITRSYDGSSWGESKAKRFVDEGEYLGISWRPSQFASILWLFSSRKAGGVA